MWFMEMIVDKLKTRKGKKESRHKLPISGIKQATTTDLAASEV